MLLQDGRYRLAEQLAAGGMGEVWKGVDEVLGREVAVKLLHHQYAADPTFRARFRAEAQYTARLTHPGIAQVYDYGEQDGEQDGEQGGISFLVMELVPGEPLSALLERHRRLTADVTLDVVAQAARALQSAHAVGLIHRDIKPGNLLVTPDGAVKLTDFGIARAVEAVTLTQTGMVMGTAHYVSPEQAAGKPLTPATDIYSLGVVAYECLAGGPPFTAETVVTVALKHVRESPPPLPDDVPEPVQELVALALEKDPAGRPGSAGELADRAHVVRETLALGPSPPVTGQSTLPNLLAAGGDHLGPDPMADTAATPADAAASTMAVGAPYQHETGDTGRPARRRRAPALVLGAALVLAGALVVGALWRGGDDREGQHVGQTTNSPGSGGVVGPVVSATPSPAPSDTFAEPPQGGEPDDNISPRPSRPDRPTPTDADPNPSPGSPTSPTGSPSSPSPPTSPAGGEEHQEKEDRQ